MRVRLPMLATLSLSDCVAGLNYKQPDAPVPTTYKELDGWKPETPAWLLEP